MNLFAKACGATGPLQLSVERSDDPAIERHIFDAPFLTVGRDPRADLCLTHRGISRRHAYLQLVSGRLFCLDLGSRFGTYVGGECHQAGWVGRRQVIRIGPYRLRLDAGDREPWASSGADANGGAPAIPGGLEPAAALPGALGPLRRAIRVANRARADPDRDFRRLRGAGPGSQRIGPSLQPLADLDGDLGRRPARDRWRDGQWHRRPVCARLRRR